MKTQMTESILFARKGGFVTRALLALVATATAVACHIGDFVWFDQNQNGIQDTGETGVSGVQVNLYDGSGNYLGNTTTDGTGWYELSLTGDRWYSLQFVLPTGYVFTVRDAGTNDAKDSDADPLTGNTVKTYLSANEYDPTWDAGLVSDDRTGLIGDFVWLDMDADGVQDAGEPGVPNVTVTLYDGAGNPIGVTSTDGLGYYLFDNLSAGSYRVGFTAPPDSFFTAKNAGVDGAVDSDADASTGLTALIDLAPGEEDRTWDAGLLPFCFLRSAIGDRVWDDLDGDGVQDAGEPGHAGVTVHLLDYQENVIGTTTTDRDGYYLFDGLTYGVYAVRFEEPSGFVFTVRNAGGDPAADSDPDLSTGTTVTTSIEPGEWDLTWDAGLVEAPSGRIELLKFTPQREVEPFDSITYYYTLYNDGAPATTVQGLVDDAGTPGYAADDFAPDFLGGDTNSSGLLDPGETWLYRAVAYAPLIMCQPLGDTNAFAGTLVVSTAPGSGDLTATFVASRGVNDNAYGTGAGPAGWPGSNHKFMHLVGSDMAELQFLDGAGNMVFHGRIDYLGASSDYPSGYGTLGVTGGDGAVYVGNAADVKGVGTSLTDNLLKPMFQSGYTVDSPPEPNADWEYRMIYRITLDGALFAANGFGEVTVVAVHNSPYKTFDITYPDPCETSVVNVATATVVVGGETRVLTDDASVDVRIDVIPAEIGNRVWNDLDADGVQDTGEPGVADVYVELFNQAGDLVGATLTDTNGLYRFTGLSAGSYSVGFTAPSGFAFTSLNAGGDPARDSDANPATGRAAYTSLAAGESDMTWDAGLVADAVPPPTSTGTCVPATLEFTGSSSTDGPDGNIRTFSDGSLSVKVSAFSRDKSSGAWETAYLGLFGSGLGVTDRSEGSGGGDSHTVDNIGRDNYVLFEFSEPVVIDRAYLGYVVGDSDLTAWVGTFADPFNNHLSLNDAVLGAFGFTEDNTTTSSSARWADLNAGAVVGNALVIAAWLGDSTPEDRFKIRKLDVCVPQNPPSASLGDRVWIEIQEDGIQQLNEPGKSGVLVTLYDGSGGTVATTTTDSEGYYLFDNLAPGTYRVGFTLPSGFVWTFRDQGTSDALDSDVDPVTGLAVQTTLDADENDLTWDAGLICYCPFKAAIGDFVWEDLNADGIQDVGEPGVPGVLVTLYDSGSAAIATTNTGANGFYLFPDLVPGTYRVGFTAPAGFALTAQDQGSDEAKDSDADPVSGLAAFTTLAPSETDLTWDAGLVRELCSVGDFVWFDLNKNGIQDPLELGKNAVPVTLFNAASNVVGTTQTDTNGFYQFTGLAPGWYYLQFQPVTSATVKITAKDQGGDDLKDSDADPVTGLTVLFQLVGGQHDPTRDCGIIEIETFAAVTGVRAFGGADGVTVEWRTDGELGVVGFELFRDAGNGGAGGRVGGGVVPVLPGAEQGAVYRVRDASAAAGGAYAYRLVEHRFDGSQEVHGPFAVTVEPEAAQAKEAVRGARGVVRAPADPVLAGGSFEVRPNAVDAQPSALRGVRSLTAALPGKEAEAGVTSDRLKLTVTESTIHYVGADQVAALTGRTLADIRGRIQSGRLRLTRAGQAVPYLAAAGYNGLYFYGQAYHDVYTDRSVYWLEMGNGLGVGVTGLFGPQPAAGGTYTHTAVEEADVYAQTGVYDDANADYWLWDYLVANTSFSDKSFSISAPGASGTGPAGLKVNLKGTTPSHHHVQVYLNGTFTGELEWDGTTDKDDVTFPIANGALVNDGANTVRLVALLDAGQPYSTVYLDSIELTYQRTFTAQGGMLFLRGDGRPVVTADGFDSPHVAVLDVTDPNDPVLVIGTTVDFAGGSYRVSFRPADPAAEYFVFNLGVLRAPDQVEAVPYTDLATNLSGADYVVIAPAGLETAARRLADYRATKGLSTKLVAMEDVFNEFNDGFFSPLAIKAFLAHAYANWSVRPLYVLLAGEGTYDYRNLTGHGDSLVPALMVPTPNGLFASDNELANVAGDVLPEMAIGRIPVTTAAALNAVIDKIIAYEAQPAGPWTEYAVFAADNPDEGGDFEASCAAAAAMLPSGVTFDTADLDRTPPDVDAARTELLGFINPGARVLTYFGHSGLRQWAQEQWFRHTDVQAMANGPRLPVAAQFTCVAGRHEVPGYTVLSEYLVTQPSGGAIACWSPSGLSLNSLAERLAVAFHDVLWNGEPQHGNMLGDVVWAALERYRDEGRPEFMIHIYNLLGDPATELQ